jgi:hypothetical protein
LGLQRRPEELKSVRYLLAPKIAQLPRRGGAHMVVAILKRIQELLHRRLRVVLRQQRGGQHAWGISVVSLPRHSVGVHAKPDGTQQRVRTLLCANLGQLRGGVQILISLMQP